MKNNLLKILVIVYDVISLVWVGIISLTLYYNLFSIRIDEGTNSIIGGADISFITSSISGSIGFFATILFVFSVLATVILLTFSVFKRSSNRRLTILTSALVAVCLLLFILIPQHSYVEAFYLLLRKVLYFYSTRDLYIIISSAIIPINIFTNTKRENDNENA